MGWEPSGIAGMCSEIDALKLPVLLPFPLESPRTFFRRPSSSSTCGSIDDMLTLLLLLLLRPCPEGTLESFVPCRLIDATNGAAPGTVSSVNPLREFGARATTDDITSLPSSLSLEGLG